MSYSYNHNIPRSDGRGITGAIASINNTALTVLSFESANNFVDVAATPDTQNASGTCATAGNGSSGLFQCGGGQTSGASTDPIYATGYMSGVPPTPSAAVYTGPTGRHLEGSNFLLCDGHVKWFRGDKVASGFGNGATGNESADGFNAAGSQSTDMQSKYAITFSPF